MFVELCINNSNINTNTNTNSNSNTDINDIKYNQIDNDVIIDETDKFYVYLSDTDILYETMRRTVEPSGLVTYNVIKYKGEVIDTIDEYGDYYNIVKFNYGDVEEEVIPERRLLQNHFNVWNEEVIPYKLKYFDFKKPLKFKIKDAEDEDDDDEDY